MAHGYTPGLRVAAHTTLQRLRRLPLAGSVLVKQGDVVRAEDVVARAELPGDVATVNVVNQLSVPQQDLENYMLKKVGDPVRPEEVIAETRPFIKWFKGQAKSPIGGTIESVSKITGQVMVRGAPKPVDLRAYVDGTIAEVYPTEGVLVETKGTFIQGILGIGGEVCGEMAVAARGPDVVLKPDDLDASLAGKIVLAGALVTGDVYHRATELGLAALVCGGFRDSDLRALLGYDLGVAITGHEDVHPILIMTEGFGQMTMARATYELLASHAGHRASANGTTQIRAGVMRPEIIIPAAAAAQAAPDKAIDTDLGIGSPVRLIREPGFGRLGKVSDLPSGTHKVESEATVRIVEVAFPDGSRLTVPRANIEVISG